MTKDFVWRLAERSVENEPDRLLSICLAFHINIVIIIEMRSIAQTKFNSVDEKMLFATRKSPNVRNSEVIILECLLKLKSIRKKNCLKINHVSFSIHFICPPLCGNVGL